MDLEVYLQQLDDSSRTDRAARLSRIVPLIDQPNGVMLFGGAEMAIALGEMRACYVDGHFVASVMLAQVTLEHLLCGLFSMAGGDSERKLAFGRLLKKAVAEGYLTEQEAEQFEIVRQRRNPYAHSRGVSDPTSLMMRAAGERRPLDELVEADAQHAVEVVLRLLNRPPFMV